MHEKEIEKLQAEKEKVERQLAQEKHKIQRLENRAAYYEKGDRRKRAHRLITRGAAIESVAPQTKELGETEFYTFAEQVFALPATQRLLTHTDKLHIHNHIIWNSTTLDCTRKFRNFWGSTEAVRKLSDLACMEHRLSVIENPKPHGKSYNKWLGGNAKPCQRDLLRAAIDAALAQKPKDFETFLKLVEAAGYTVKRGKHVTFMWDGQLQNIRLRSLGEGYSEEELRAVILGTRVHTPRRKKRYPSKVSRPTLISQIEAKIGSGKGAAYDQKLKVVKLKSMAETLLFIQKHDFADFDALSDYADAASVRTKELTAKIKAAENRMAEIAVLKTHIINYAKTRDVYTTYRKAGYSKKYYDAHESDILIHKAAKKAFDDLALKKLPTVKSLQAEYRNSFSHPGGMPGRKYIPVINGFCDIARASGQYFF